MPKINQHISFLFSSLLLCAAVFILYPFYQYYIDTDATSYLAISQRYADGEYLRAINGYWSPFACWLTAILIKNGFSTFPAAIIINTIAAVCFLCISNSFFLLFKIENHFRWVLNISLSLFLSYAVFKQSFDDLWECFFLLTALRILLSPHFLNRWDLWVWMGVFGGFAYYAKAYSFPFFILNTLCCIFYITKAWQKHNRVQWIKISVVAIAAMIIIASPWIYLLHEKYGMWMTSTAGTLNLSWYPVGHPYYKEGVLHLLPPIYPDSPSYWEDPWLVNGDTPHFWNSTSLFFRQILRLGYNLFLLVKCLAEISLFMIPISLVALYAIISPMLRGRFGDNFVIVAISFLLFPLGFLLINFEARYIWYMILPGIVLGALTIQWLKTNGLNSTRYYLLIFLFGLSFILYPLWDMKTLHKAGEQEFKIAQQLKELNIKGSFTANVVFSSDNNDLEEVTRLAYFSGNPYYNMPYLGVPYPDLLKDMRRHHVKYFFYYHSGHNGNVVLYDEKGLPFPEVSARRFNSLKIFQIHP